MTNQKPPAPRGRPIGSTRASEHGSTVSTCVPASYHERLVRIAQERDMKVSALVRQLLIVRVP